MARNLQQLVPANVSGGDLAPLFANDSYTRVANAELLSTEAAEAATAAKLATEENYRGTITLFANATSSLRAIAKKFPETSKFVDEAVKQTQLAMSACAGNPTKIEPVPGTISPAGPTPVAGNEPWRRKRWTAPTTPNAPYVPPSTIESRAAAADVARGPRY